MDNNQEEKKPIGILFDNLSYHSIDQMDEFISNMNYEQAIYCLVEAVQAAYRRDIYSMSEIEVISKSIRVISNKKRDI